MKKLLFITLIAFSISSFSATSDGSNGSKSASKHSSCQNKATSDGSNGKKNTCPDKSIIRKLLDIIAG